MLHSQISIYDSGEAEQGRRPLAGTAARAGPARVMEAPAADGSAAVCGSSGGRSRRAPLSASRPAPLAPCRRAALSPLQSEVQSNSFQCSDLFIFPLVYRSSTSYYMQIMASSQNGLSIGDSLPHNIVESPAWSETASPPQTPSRTPPARPLPHVWAQAPPSSQGRR
ncbi:hypothetical protein SEVIR_4G193126v4 [Setaria viridis]